MVPGSEFGRPLTIPGPPWPLLLLLSCHKNHSNSSGRGLISFQFLEGREQAGCWEKQPGSGSKPIPKFQERRAAASSCDTNISSLAPRSSCAQSQCRDRLSGQDGAHHPKGKHSSCPSPPQHWSQWLHVLLWSTGAREGTRDTHQSERWMSPKCLYLPNMW